LRINRGKAVETFSAKHHVMRLGSVWTHTNFVTTGIDPSGRLFVPPGAAAPPIALVLFRRLGYSSHISSHGL